MIMRGFELALSVRTNSLAKGFLLLIPALFLVAPLAAGQSAGSNSGSWSGILVSSGCNADEAFFESPECNKVVPGAKVSLYDDTNRVIYNLEPQEKVGFHLGDTVTVRGRLERETIQLNSIERMTIGLAVGEKAPAFSVRDQFGRAQTLETLKGRNGTVLLFFRSADW